MTSSMLTGERRWASGRRSGMTVLGKVAVPKPINLPSQKLENHGMDPNVEIVPKGTLSWGSRQSSSTSNAWGSSTLSPKADSGTGSPSHLSGRPSSGGSGTRPSTGSSDKVHESIASAWSSNSRPSSASGALTSNQTSLASLRPRSAETRPGSSQLSRFAESFPERSVAWGAGAAEKLGVATSRNDGFSLTSGDFPTLGSEKENAEKDTESQDHGSHGRPGSSGGAGPVKDRTGTSIAGDVPVNSNTKGEPASSWRRHSTPYGEDGIRPSVEKWPVDPQGHQPYPNAGIPPQHYDAWPGPPMNNHPGGVWYRGPPGGPPYGAPVPPGGFPMEPYHFYRPHIPQALPNSQPVPPPGAGPRAHHPKNGDIYRPHMPDAFVRPGVPIRPGFYPGPVSYESYYGPPMGYPNPNEREVPFVGRPAGPSAYNRHSAQSAHNPGDFHSRPCGYGSNSKALPPEQMESSNSNDTRGPYRVLLKQHDCWDGKQEHKREESLTANASLAEKGDQLRSSSLGDDLKGGNKNEEEIGLRRKPFGEKSPFQTSDYDGGSLVHAKVKSPESKRNAMAVEEISMKKVELTASAFREIPAGQKDSSLIQKIEGLNAKTRAPEGRHDLMSVSTREEQKNRSQALNVGFNNSIKEAASGSFYSERDNTSCINNPVVGGVNVSAGDKSIESPAASGAASSRRSTQGMHGRTDHHGKGKYNVPEGDGWRKKFMDSNVTSATHSGIVSSVHMQERAPKEATEKSGSYPQAKNEGNSATSDVDPSDDKTQRAKMRELAKQRVQQRQKEEEERLREQKAKALAKLEELDKRKLPTEDSKQNLDSSLTNAAENKQEESHFVAEATVVSSQSVALTSAVVSDSNFVKQVSDAGSGVDKSTISGNDLLPERPKSGHNEHVPTRRHGLSEAMKQGNADVVPHSNVLQVYDLGDSKQKRVSYKQKHNISVEKNFDISITTGTTELQKIHTDVDANTAASPENVANETASDCGTNAPVNANVTAESSIHQRRRNNRSGKKHKMEEAASAATLSSMVQQETIIFGTSGERGKTTVSEPEMKPELDSGAFQSRTDSKDENQFSEKRISSPNEENRGRANNQWKSQHSRRPRSSQANKSADKFHTTDAVIWAPVRSQNKVEVTGEAGQKIVIDAPSNKSEHQVQNNLRNRRAELERYVPKPVAKEMAQRGSSQQQVAPSVDQTATSDETIRRPNCGSQLVESSQPGSKNGDSRLNKQGKAHGSWRQRTSAEPTVVQGSQGGESLNSNRNVQKPIERQQPEMIDVCQVKEQPKYQDEWGFSDGWTMPEDPDATVPPPVIVKDLGVSARGKRHQYKGPKGTGNNYDHEHKKIISEDFEKTHIQSSVPAAEMSSKENRVVGDRSSSHWQPKPQTFSASNQQGSRPSSGQNIRAEAGMANKKVVSDILAQSHHGQSSSQMPSKFEEAPNAGNQETKRERRMASAKGRPHSPNHGPALENAPLSKPDTRYEQRMSSGFRRSGNQNNRSGRGHETRGDWSSSGQDDKQHTQPVNRERQRHNSHYEYQPVGHGPHYSGSRANNYEVPKDGPSNTGGRYKERGPNHPRRGGVNFHGRASGTVRAADGYD